MQCLSSISLEIHCQKNKPESRVYILAEREGFEPSVSCPTLVFKTSTINHSVTSPGDTQDILAKPLQKDKVFGLEVGAAARGEAADNEIDRSKRQDRYDDTDQRV